MKRRKNKKTSNLPLFESDSDENFAFIAGYTSGGAPYGVTWEEWEKFEKNEQPGLSIFTANENAFPFLEWAPDFNKWPESWVREQNDLEHGQALLPYFAYFLQNLYDKGFSRKTFRNYRDDLWLLGGSIISSVSTYGEHHIEPLNILKDALTGGGLLPDGFNQMSAAEMKDFSRMCRRFENFLDSLMSSYF